MTGFDEAEPASRNDMFMSAPKNAANPVRQSDDQPDPDGHLTERDQWGEPRLGIVVEQGLDEGAVPVVRDRGAAGVRDRHGALPVPLQRGAAVHPALAAELVVAGLQPGEADEEADRQPEQAGPRIAEQESGEGRAFDLDRLAARLRAHLEEDDEEREE